MFPDAVTAGSALNRDPHSGAEAVAQLGGIGGFLFGKLLHFSVPNHGKLWKSLMHAEGEVL
jgi:hypothetical protein